MTKTNLSCLLIALFLNACSSDDSVQESSSNTIIIGGTAFTQIDGNNISISNSATAGDGTLMGLNPLGSLASGKNFKLEASLKAGGSIILKAYADNSGNNGLNLNFTNSNNALVVTASGSDFSSDLTSYFSDASPTDFTFYIDVHNDETPAHVLVWDKDPTTTPIYDSEDDTPGFEANGSDTYFGVTLDSASLKKLTLSSPNLEGE